MILAYVIVVKTSSHQNNVYSKSFSSSPFYGFFKKMYIYMFLKELMSPFWDQKPKRKQLKNERVLKLKKIEIKNCIEYFQKSNQVSSDFLLFATS